MWVTRSRQLLDPLTNGHGAGKEVSLGDTDGFFVEVVEEGVELVLHFSGDAFGGEHGEVSGSGVLAESRDEVLELSAVEEPVIVGVVGGEGGNKLSHALSLGILSRPGGLLGDHSGSLVVGERGDPDLSELRASVKVFHLIVDFY